MHMLFSMLAVLIHCVLSAQTKPVELEALVEAMDNHFQQLWNGLTHEHLYKAIDRIVQKRINIFRTALLTSFADVFGLTEENKTSANDTTTSAAICPNGQMLNYFYEMHRPKYCVLNRPKDLHYNGKCVNMLDLFNRFNSSGNNAVKNRVYFDENHHTVSFYECLVLTNQSQCPFLFNLTGNDNFNAELVIAQFAEYFSVDEADNTISRLRVLRTLPQSRKEYLGPFSLCKILLDNNVYQFLSQLDKNSIKDCPKQIITSPPCTPKTLSIPDGVKYGVKFENGIPTKCQVRSFSSSKCVKVSESIEMLKNFEKDEYSMKDNYSNSRRNIYDGKDNGFSRMLKNNDSVVDAMEKLKNVLGLEENILVEGTINGQKFKMGAVTFCSIFSMHVPFSDSVLRDHSEEC